MTPIEHFLLDNIQKLFRDWIETKIPDIGRYIATTDIFLPTLRKYFTNAGRRYFFTIQDAFLVGVAVKIYNVGRLGFFVRAQPKLCFGRHRHVFFCSERKTFANLGKKTWFTDTDRRKFKPTSARKVKRSRFKKEASPDDADRTFPNRHHHPNTIQGLYRKYNSRHRSL